MANQASNYIPGVRRRQVTPLYDTLTVTAGAFGTKSIMFGHLAGSDGIQVTNMTKAFELPGPECFTVFALRCVLLSCALADVKSLYINKVIRLTRGRAIELEAPVEYFGGGAGIHGFTTDATSNFYNNGTPDSRAIASLGDNPIVIEGSDHIEVSVEGPTFTATANVIMRVYLDGWFDKGVQ